MKFLSYHHLIWVLPILLGATAALYWSIRQRRQAIQLLTNHAAKCNLQTNASPLRRRILTVSLFSALVLTLLAVLRPTGGTEFNENKKPAKNLIVLLDVSLGTDMAMAWIHLKGPPPPADVYRHSHGWVSV